MAGFPCPALEQDVDMAQPSDEAPAGDSFAQAFTPVAPWNSFGRPSSSPFAMHMTSTPNVFDIFISEEGNAVPSKYGNLDVNQNEQGNVSLNVSTISKLSPMVKQPAGKSLTPSKLSLDKSCNISFVENTASETISLSERSRFFQYDKSGAIVCMDVSSPPLEVLDRMLNNFHYDPTRPKCTGYTNSVSSGVSSASLYVTAKSHNSETNNDSTNISAPRVLNFSESEISGNPGPLKPLLETIFEDKNNLEKTDTEVVSQAEETVLENFCDNSRNSSIFENVRRSSKNFMESSMACPADLSTQNSSTLENVQSLFETPKNVAKPTADLNSSSASFSILESAPFLLKTPKYVDVPCGESSANLHLFSFSAGNASTKNLSTLENVQSLLDTPKNVAKPTADLDSSSASFSILESAPFLLKTPKYVDVPCGESSANLHLFSFSAGNASTKNLSTLENVQSLLETPKNVAKPTADLDSSSASFSIFESAPVLLKTPKYVDVPCSEFSTNLDTFSFSSGNASTMEDAPSLVKTLQNAENTRSLVSVPFSSGSKNRSLAEESISENTRILMSFAKKLAESNAPANAQLPTLENRSLIDSFSLDDISFTDESTFSFLVFTEECIESSKDCHVVPSNSVNAFDIAASSTSRAANIAEETTAETVVKSIIPRKGKTAARRSSIHKGKLSVSKLNVSVSFTVAQKNDGTNKILRRSKRLSTSKLKASATVKPIDPAASTLSTGSLAPLQNKITTGCAPVSEPAVSTDKNNQRRSVKPSNSKPAFPRQSVKITSQQGGGRSFVSRLPQKSSIPQARRTATQTTVRPSIGRPALPRQSVKITTQQGNARSLVSRLPQKSLIPQARLSTVAQMASVRPSVAKPAPRRTMVPLNNRTSTRQSSLLPENVNANRTYCNPFVTRTQLISSVVPSVVKSSNVAKKLSATVGTRPKSPKGQTAVKKRNCTNKQLNTKVGTNMAATHILPPRKNNN